MFIHTGQTAYIDTSIRACIHKYIHTHIYRIASYIHTYIHTYIHDIDAHIAIQTWDTLCGTPTHTRSAHLTHTHTLTHTYTHIHFLQHTHESAHILDTHTHTHTHTHTLIAITRGHKHTAHIHMHIAASIRSSSLQTEAHFGLSKFRQLNGDAELYVKVSTAFIFPKRLNSLESTTGNNRNFSRILLSSSQTHHIKVQTNMSQCKNTHRCTHTQHVEQHARTHTHTHANTHKHTTQHTQHNGVTGKTHATLHVFKQHTTTCDTHKHLLTTTTTTRFKKMSSFGQYTIPSRTKQKAQRKNVVNFEKS